jgi:hypothetical protein
MNSGALWVSSPGGINFYTNGNNLFSIDSSGATTNQGTFNSIGLIYQNSTKLDDKYQPKNAKNTYLYVSYANPDTVSHQSIGKRLVLYQETTPYFNSNIGVSGSGGIWLT